MEFNNLGYKNEKARSQAADYSGLSKDKSGRVPTTPSFVAPGFPVEVAPPPTAPPIIPVIAGGASAASAASPFGLALLAGGAIGLGIGLWTKADIDRFKKNAKQPFYDPNQVFNPGLKHGGFYSDDLVYHIGDPDWGESHPKELAQIIDHWLEHENLTHQPSLDWIQNSYETGPSGWYARGWEHVVCTGEPAAANYQVNHSIVGHTVFTGDLVCGMGYLSAGASDPFTEVAPFGILLSSVVAGFRALPSGHPTESWQWPGVYPGNDGTDWRLLEPNTVYRTRIQVGDDLSWPSWEASPAPPYTQPVGDDYAKPEDNKVDVPLMSPFPVTAVHLGHGQSLRGPITRVTIPRPGPGGGVHTPVVDVAPPAGDEDTPPKRNKRRRGKEKVVNISMESLTAGGLSLVNFVTEANDLITALWDALPKDCKHKRKVARGETDAFGLAERAPWMKAVDLFNCWSRFDAAKGIENVINNQIEDAIYGRYFGITSNAQKRLGVTAGLARAGRGTGHLQRKFGKKFTPKLVVPEVHFTDGEMYVGVGEVYVGTKKERD